MHNEPHVRQVGAFKLTSCAFSSNGVLVDGSMAVKVGPDGRTKTATAPTDIEAVAAWEKVNGNA